MDQKKESHFYSIIPSKFGDIGIVRRAASGSSTVCMILLPEAGCTMARKVARFFPCAVPGRVKDDEVASAVRDSLNGKSAYFNLDRMDFGSMSWFAKRVLMSDAAIPRGRVMAYGGLAAAVGAACGARAVGNVMAGNPFPLVIPCHRVVRSDGALGGFGGGLEMKRELLAMEGVVFDAKVRVLPEYFYRP